MATVERGAASRTLGARVRARARSATNSSAAKML